MILSILLGFCLIGSSTQYPAEEQNNLPKGVLMPVDNVAAVAQTGSNDKNTKSEPQKTQDVVIVEKPKLGVADNTGKTIIPEDKQESQNLVPKDWKKDTVQEIPSKTPPKVVDKETIIKEDTGKEAFIKDETPSKVPDKDLYIKDDGDVFIKEEKDVYINEDWMIPHGFHPGIRPYSCYRHPPPPWYPYGRVPPRRFRCSRCLDYESPYTPEKNTEVPKSVASARNLLTSMDLYLTKTPICKLREMSQNFGKFLDQKQQEA